VLFLSLSLSLSRHVTSAHTQLSVPIGVIHRVPRLCVCMYVCMCVCVWLFTSCHSEAHAFFTFLTVQMTQLNATYADGGLTSAATNPTRHSIDVTKDDEDEKKEMLIRRSWGLPYTNTTSHHVVAAAHDDVTNEEEPRIDLNGTLLDTLLNPDNGDGDLHVDYSDVLGRGYRGSVYGGTLRGVPVAVKKFYDGRNTVSSEDARCPIATARHSPLLGIRVQLDARHANIVELLGVAGRKLDDGSLGDLMLVMEQCDDSLRAMLRRGASRPPQCVCVCERERERENRATHTHTHTHRERLFVSFTYSSRAVKESTFVAYNVRIANPSTASRGRHVRYQSEDRIGLMNTHTRTQTQTYELSELPELIIVSELNIVMLQVQLSKINIFHIHRSKFIPENSPKI